MNNSVKTDWIIPLYKIYTDDEDISAITKIVKRGNRWALGPEINEFENSIKEYLGVDYCVVLNSGTSSLHASLLAYDLGETSEIIVPSFSFIATVNSVLFIGAHPKFADIEETTFGLDANSILNQVTPKTKAIIPMDYGGMSCDIFKIQEIAKENDLILIEDAAEGLGASINGKKVGSISDCSIFSFCGNKVLTTGEGGAVTTNSKDIYEKIKLICSHGRIDTTDYFSNPFDSKYVGIGYNWRMSSLTASLGISQLKKLDKMIKMRQENANYISNRISKNSQISVPKIPNGYEHIFQMYTIRLPNETIRSNLHQFLINKRIFSKVYFNPIHNTKFYKEKFPSKSIVLPITEMIAKQVLTLPLYPNMTLEEKDYLINSINEFFELDP